MANAKQGFIEKMYIKTVVDSQPLLIVPTEQKETQNAKKDSHMRLPISVALLEELAALKNLHLEYKEAQLVGDRVKEIVDNYLKKLDTESITIPQEFLAAIDESSYWDSSNKQKKALNWKAIILKIHEAIVETPKSFEVLTNFVKPLSASTEKAMDKITSASEEDTPDEEDEEDSDTAIYSSSPGRGSSIPSSAFAHGSMAWVGPTNPSMAAPTGPGLLQQKTPQLMKSSPFIPIKGHKKKKNVLVENVIATSPKLSLRSSSDKIVAPAISVPKQEEGLVNQPMARSFDGKSGSVGLLAATLNSSLSFPAPNAPEIPLTTTGAPMRASSTFSFDSTQTSSFPTTIPLQTTPGVPQSTSIPTTSVMPTTTAPIETVGSFPRAGPTEVSQNLPPMRLTESALRHVGIGQSLIYAKAPLVDPIRVDQPTTSVTTPPLPEVTSQSYQPSEELTVFLEAPHASELIVYPASYFRRKEEKELLERTVLSDIMITHESVSLPRWLDLLVYWGAKPNDEGIPFTLESVLVACMSSRHLDVWLQSALSHALYATLTQILNEKIPPHYRALATAYLSSYSSVVTESKSEERLKETWRHMSEHAWTKQHFEKVVTEVVTARYDFQIEKVMNTLESNLLLFLKTGHPSLKHIEQILVSLLGHDVPQARERAVKLLNTLYDGHDWQLTEAFQPVIRYIDDSFVIELDIENYTIDKNNVYMIVYSPNSIKPNTYVLSRYVPLIVDEKKLVLNLGSFKCAGYYDWRFVSLDQDGNYVPLLSKTGGKKLSKVQGRVIVQPAIREEIIHEVWVEAHDSDWDRRNDNLVKKGNFLSVAKAIPEYQNKYKVSTLYVMGALERNKHANPFAPTDRSAPNRWLGGASDFENLVATAKSLGVKIMVDSTARLSARGCHRKYRDLLCHILDGETDALKPHPGSDGRDFTWNDCVLLNFRKRATWELMVNEIRDWATRGVSGIRLDAAHSWPLILRPNSIELLREDNDGQYHYSLEEILEGHVVLPATDEANSYGYYGTEASHEYPNPLFIKMTRQIWKEFPNFVFLGEIYWNREPNAITSGLIPYASGLPRALASVFDLGIHKDGSITYLPERKSVRVFYDWYQRERLGYPQNALTVYPSSSHYLPYPTSIYGAGSWAAIDLLLFLPEVPLTYGNEHKGYTVSMDVTKNKYVAAEFDKTIRNLDFSQIQGHYEHRAMMRKNYPVLREGGMIPLFAYWGNGWHDRVFAFARFTKKQMAIIAINFNDVESIFYVDHSPLEGICEMNNNVIYRVVDFINPTNPPQYYSADEFLQEKKYIRLGAYASMCWGVYVQAESPTSQRVLYEHSLGRLQRLLSNGLDPANNMIYTIITEGLNKGLTPFSECLKRISEQTGMSNALALPGTLQYILYSVVKPLPDLHTKALSYLTYLSQKGDGFQQRLCQQILQNNIMGPIVFITPEMGRFSTVGGVGVMVDELTRALAALGLDIHVISPYYNFNRKGKTGYLEAEGVLWLQNIVTYIGFEYCEVGIHQGKEHGVQLHFLHNFNYFPTPYSTGSPSYQLKQIVLMAKASLELCCQLRILPSLVVTNDWFTALVPAYAKRSGSFGTTFSGTTFFHLIHNLEEGYEGKIYVDGQDDLGSIHQLSRELFVESFPGGVVLNASRAALQTCDQWGTVSTSYRDDLIRTSPLGPLLARYPQPFGKQNGIRLEERLALLKTVAKDHEEAKAKLQKKYFGESDPSIPILAFIGRIVLQKGVHLILNAVREIVDMTKGRVQIIVGGMANMKDPYAAQCAWSMEGLRKQFPKQFWADPYEFFTDGPLVNYGTDFGLMPSLFEPSGVVQQEFFAGGTPVIAFKTGGLKDSVFEFDVSKGTGNGFTFEAHAHGDFVYAVSRALNVFWNKENYAKLRKSSRDSVLDVEEVAIAWTREYTRLRQRIWSPPNALAQCIKEIEKSAKNEEVPQEEKKENTM